MVTLVDDAGTTVQELGVPQRPVRDVAVSPDGRWAVTAGDDGEVFRWDVDPATGRWSGPEALRGHTGDVVGRRGGRGAAGIVATVSVDHTAIIRGTCARTAPAGRGTAEPRGPARRGVRDRRRATSRPPSGGAYLPTGRGSPPAPTWA